MDMESKYGQMELDMKGTGDRIRLVEKESSGTLMETFLKDSGKTTRQTDMGCICM